MSKLIYIVLLSVMLYSCNRDNRGLVVGKIHKASKLATTEFTIDKIVHGTKSKKIGWLIKLSEARFLLRSKVIVKAGVDLKRLKKEDIEIDGKSISIVLPPIEVLNFSYPPDSMFIDNEVTRNAFLNQISVVDQEEFLRRAELDVRANLQFMGIVETSQQKTRTMLTALLSSLNYEEIYIRFQSDELILDQVPEEDI
ncbi:MAG: DUF4230 domain-containing protein [Cytophagales bacterium]|nr:DUF4230 domain-containing protein [Cytophagales bacterium]